VRSQQRPSQPGFTELPFIDLVELIVSKRVDSVNGRQLYASRRLTLASKSGILPRTLRSALVDMSASDFLLQRGKPASRHACAWRFFVAV
jgi:hypothetical protein